MFSHLYTQEKTLQEFKKDDSEFGIAVSSEFMDKINQEGNKKITIEVGGSKKFQKKSKA